VPIICIVIGEGGSGGALALGVGNKVLMLENAIYSVISPEGAASILYKDASKSLHAAEAMRITAHQILELGVVDDVIPEPRGGAHRDLAIQAESMKAKIWQHLEPLLSMSEQELIEDRYRRFREIGRFTFSQEENHA
jgi:acetyl-CoA carboxylase carboxyl transferase subunit alpha